MMPLPGYVRFLAARACMFPTGDRSRKRLTIIVGEENAAKMIFHFDGVKLTLPMLSSLEIKKRHQAIIEDAKKGMSHRDIAMKYDLTDRQVRRIISDS